MKKILLGSIVLLALTLTACFGPKADYTALTQCLTEKGFVEYGTFWCPNCAQQKKILGDAFDYVTYIECDPRGENEQSGLCLDKNIQSYPTWENPEGEQWIGVQEPETLSEISECPI